MKVRLTWELLASTLTDSIVTPEEDEEPVLTVIIDWYWSYSILDPEAVEVEMFSYRTKMLMSSS